MRLAWCSGPLLVVSLLSSCVRDRLGRVRPPEPADTTRHGDAAAAGDPDLADPGASDGAGADDDLAPSDGCVTAAAASALAATWSGCGPFTIQLEWQGSAASYDVELWPEAGTVQTLSGAASAAATVSAAETYHWRVRPAATACAEWSEGPPLYVGAGRLWQQLTASGTPFPARQGHSVIASPDKLWVIAGNAIGDFNDVWSSPDGASWTQATASAAFAPRRWLTGQYFAGSLIVIGGNYAEGPTNVTDIHTSIDGVSWSPLGPDPFEPRHAPTSAVLNGRLWVMAGEGPNCSTRNDVWSSADGAAWTQATAAAAFPSRDWSAAASFAGRLWVVAGINRGAGCGVTYLDDVWSSADGVTWQLEAQGAFPARGGHSVAVFDGKLWVIGGTQAYPAATQSDVWYSSDGAVWCEATSTHDFSNRYGHAAATLGDRLYVIGGFDGAYKNDVWFTQ